MREGEKIVVNGYQQIVGQSVVYLAKCLSCDKFYIGKTMQCLRDGIYQHTYSLRRRDSNIALAKHFLKEGNDKYVFTVIDRVVRIGRGRDDGNTLDSRVLNWQILTWAYTRDGWNEAINIMPVLKMKAQWI